MSHPPAFGTSNSDNLGKKATGSFAAIRPVMYTTPNCLHCVYR